ASRQAAASVLREAALIRAPARDGVTRRTGSLAIARDPLVPEETPAKGHLRRTQRPRWGGLHHAEETAGGFEQLPVPGWSTAGRHAASHQHHHPDTQQRAR